MITSGTIERIKMLKAMEYIARHINDEEVFNDWLICGIPDGEIAAEDLSVKTTDAEELKYILNDNAFRYIMTAFQRVMRAAYKSGGLAVDGVVA